MGTYEILRTGGMGPLTYLLYCYGPYFPIFIVFPNVTALVLSYTILAPTTCELCIIRTINMSHIVKVMRTWKRQQTCRTRRSWCSSSLRWLREGARWTGTRRLETTVQQDCWSSCKAVVKIFWLQYTWYLFCYKYIPPWELSLCLHVFALFCITLLANFTLLNCTLNTPKC